LMYSYFGNKHFWREGNTALGQTVFRSAHKGF